MKVLKLFDLINRTDMVKTSLKEAKIQVRFKKMFYENNVYFKATHYFINKKLIFTFFIIKCNYQILINVSYSNIATPSGSAIKT